MLVVIGVVPFAFPLLIDRIRLQPVIRSRRQKTRESLLLTEEFMLAPFMVGIATDGLPPQRGCRAGDPGPDDKPSTMDL